MGRQRVQAGREGLRVRAFPAAQQVGIERGDPRQGRRVERRRAERASWAGAERSRLNESEPRIAGAGCAFLSGAGPAGARCHCTSAFVPKRVELALNPTVNVAGELAATLLLAGCSVISKEAAGSTNASRYCPGIGPNPVGSYKSGSFGVLQPTCR